MGKTYSLQRFGGAYFRKVHYLNFEKDEGVKKIFDPDLNPQRILAELSFSLNSSIDAFHDLLVFDEIQHCPKALTSLKYFSEEKAQLALCAAGSLLGIHLNEGSFPVGKVEFLYLCPLNFEEFLLACGDEKSVEILTDLTAKSSLPETVHEHLWKQLKLYFVVGGLPEAVRLYAEAQDNLFEALKSVRKKQEDLITAYHSDMAKHAGKVNAMHLERVWRHVPIQLAKEHDASAPKFRFKGIIPGHARYKDLAGAIDWLLACGLIIRVPIANKAGLPFAAYTKENCFKLYFFDVGMLSAMANLPPKTMLDYDYGTYQGYVAENLVAQEWMASGIRSLYSWNEGTAEVEFLREIEGEVLPVEVKSGWITQAKSLKVFAEKYHPPYRTVMGARNLLIDASHGFHRYPLYLASRFPLRRS